MKSLIYQIWVQPTFSEAEEAFFEIAVWDETTQQPVQLEDVYPVKTKREALKALNSTIERYPHILFKPNASGRLMNP